MDLEKSLAKIQEEEKKTQPKIAKGNKGLEILEKIETVKLIDKVLFSRYLALMIRSGVSLARGLNILSTQFASKKLSRVIKNLEEQVSEGTELSKALESHPRVFSSIYVNMVASGEVSGKLDEVLEQLAIQLRKDYTIKRKVRGAMIYPTIVLIAMAVMLTLMLIYVVPNMTKLFSDLNLELPLITRIVIRASNILKENTLIFLVIVGLIVGTWRYLKRKPAVKAIYHPILLKLPIFGKISRKVNLARFARTLSSLLVSGIPIVKALRISAKAMSNVKYQKVLEATAEKVQQGISLKESLREYPKLFPGMITQLTEVGQETGALDEILAKIAEFYENEVDQTVKNLSTVLEPVLMLVIGAGVGVLAAAVLVPIYSIVDKME